MPARPPRRPLTLVGVVTTTACVALFAWWIARTGLGPIAAGFRQIGWGLAAIVLLGGLRFALRALAWRLCVEPPQTLAFATAWRAAIAGDALGNVLPLGPLASEPTKAAFVRRDLMLGPALAALATENVFYSLSAAAMIAAGMAALLFVFDLPLVFREIGEATIAAVAALFALAALLLWTRPAIVSRTFAALTARSGDSGRIDTLRDLEHQVYTFAARRPGAATLVALCELGFHALGVVEAHLTLWLLLGAPPLLLVSFIVEGANRLITVAFKFVPLLLGVNEVGSGMLTSILGLGTTVGTTLGLVRKVRMLCWTAVGLVLLAQRGLATSQAGLGPSPHKR